MNAKTSQGFIFIAMVGVLLVLGIFSSLLVEKMQQLNESTLWRLEFHHANQALDSHLNLAQAQWEQNQLCESYQTIEKTSLWRDFVVEVQCERSTDAQRIVLEAQLKRDSKHRPIQLKKQRVVPHRV